MNTEGIDMSNCTTEQRAPSDTHPARASPAHRIQLPLQLRNGLGGSRQLLPLQLLPLLRRAVPWAAPALRRACAC